MQNGNKKDIHEIEIGDINDFYSKMFISLKRVLKSDGKMIILSARKEELENSASKMDLIITKSLHTLVNGKKAGLYELKINN